METPERFTDAVRAAFEAEVATFLPTVFRCRFHFAEVHETGENRTASRSHPAARHERHRAEGT
jgi:hypothetical protein